MVTTVHLGTHLAMPLHYYNPHHRSTHHSSQAGAARAATCSSIWILLACNAMNITLD